MNKKTLDGLNGEIDSFLQANSGMFTDLSGKIFSYAELAYEETKSCAAIADYLKKAGFSVEMGVGGIATAFRASFGRGGPVIGFLGEYDALPGLGRVDLQDGGKRQNGHGCGHNLLGVGSAAAAAALAHALARGEAPGRVVYYGCPAEEVLEGKVRMAGAGCFRELDAALSWHPYDQYLPGNALYQAMDSVEYSFYGKSAHAAIAPETGRSALDACELMSVGVNYLREHIRNDVRIHYTYLNAGEAPNIVPDYARVWYYIRCQDGKILDDVARRVNDIAAGAALMTGTRMEKKVLSHGAEMKLNPALIQLMHQVMERTPLPEYTPEELTFAGEIRAALHLKEHRPLYSGEICSPKGLPRVLPGSTDLSAVSQCVPTGFILSACLPWEIPLHHWATAACACGSAAQKGMLYAAQVLAKSGLRLAIDAELLKQVKQDFGGGCADASINPGS